LFSKEPGLPDIYSAPSTPIAKLRKQRTNTIKYREERKLLPKTNNLLGVLFKVEMNISPPGFTSLDKAFPSMWQMCPSF
jgi:hypothetical protein